MPKSLISVRNVGKCYTVFDNQGSRLLHALSPRYRSGMQEIQALQDISFDIGRGEAVALIGRNGSGKSTLLEILAGTLTPSQGEVKVNGRVSALLELGSGFNPEYTGRDNVMLNGLLLGLSRKAILARFDEIEAFAEIGAAIDRLVKTYSSGMVMRLAFAVQVLFDPEILIIDEALSVGDFFFQQKCLGHIRGLCANGVTLLFVSHDMGTVRDICTRAIYLKQGRIDQAGETSTVIQHYLSDKSPSAGKAALSTQDYELSRGNEIQNTLRDSLWIAPGRSGDNQSGHLIAVALYDEQDNPSTCFDLGSTMLARVAYQPDRERQTHVTVLIKNKYDQVVTSLGSSRLRLTPPMWQEGQEVLFELRIQLSLEAGYYSLIFKLGYATAPNQGEVLDQSTELGPISVTWDYQRQHSPFAGMVGLPASGDFTVVSKALKL